MPRSLARSLGSTLLGTLLTGALLGTTCAGTGHAATSKVAPPRTTHTSTGNIPGTAPGGTASPQAPPRTTAVDFAGTVALSNCSGAVVRTPQSQPEDPALVLSNGHCLEGGMPGPGEVVVDRPSTRSFDLLDADGSEVGTVRATKVAYATMDVTDVSLYQLDTTYQQLEAEYGITALELSATRPSEGTDISVVSGYWKRIYTCSIDGFAHELHEGDWVWQDSVRYTTPGCEVIGGTSGAPVVDTATGQVVAVNNTINEDGEECTLNNPCEVAEDGSVTVRPGVGYAQQTHLLTACVGPGSEVDLASPECSLPRP